MKQCFKCQATKPLEDFHKHPQMPDGRVNKCKLCNNADVRANRAAKVTYYRAYDRARKLGKPADNRWKTNTHNIAVRERFPQKYRARNAVNNAVRNGKMVPGPCEQCGNPEGNHGHHDDYAKPLEVRWLCPTHHREWHDRNGEAPNG